MAAHRSVETRCAKLDTLSNEAPDDGYPHLLRKEGGLFHENSCSFRGSKREGTGVLGCLARPHYTSPEMGIRGIGASARQRVAHRWTGGRDRVRHCGGALVDYQ